MKQSDLIKLIRILGMLGSEYPGERAAAALVAHRLIKSMGTSWAALLGTGGRVAARPPRGAITRVAQEWGIDHARAAEARMRQLRSENEQLRKEIAGFKNRIANIAAQERRARYQPS